MPAPEQDVSRIPAPLDAPLARLEEARQDIAKAWLMRVLDDASLEEIERMPIERIARELPELISEVIHALGEGASSLANGGRVDIGRVAKLRDGEAASPARLSQDIAALHTVMVPALSRELGALDPRLFAEAVERVAAIFGALQASAVEELVSGRVRELEWLANTDPLTGLHNLRYLRGRLDHLLGIHERYGHPFAVLAFDVDRLKQVNDAHGHAGGDRLLSAIADAARGTVRSVDTVARTGGDEFCVLAPNQAAAWGRVLAERLSAAVGAVRRPDGSAASVSIGVVACPEDGVGVEPLLELADGAMYRAKAETGRASLAPPLAPAAERA